MYTSTAPTVQYTNCTIYLQLYFGLQFKKRNTFDMIRFRFKTNPGRDCNWLFDIYICIYREVWGVGGGGGGGGGGDSKHIHTLSCGCLNVSPTRRHTTNVTPIHWLRTHSRNLQYRFTGWEKVGVQCVTVTTLSIRREGPIDEEVVFGFP